MMTWRVILIWPTLKIFAGVCRWFTGIYRWKILFTVILPRDFHLILIRISYQWISVLHFEQRGRVCLPVVNKKEILWSRYIAINHCDLVLESVFSWRMSRSSSFASTLYFCRSWREDGKLKISWFTNSLTTLLWWQRRLLKLWCFCCKFKFNISGQHFSQENMQYILSS